MTSPTSTRCTATTKRGEPCTNPAAAFGDGMCLQHSSASEAKEEQRRRLAGRSKAVDFTKYQRDPEAFARTVLGIAPWSHQVRLLESIRDNPRTSWRSCNGAGKTVAVAVAALWRLLCWDHSLVFVIGPNARLVRQVTHRAIQRLVRQAPGLRHLEPVGDVPELGYRPMPDQLLLGLTSDRPEGVAGLHEVNVTAIEEEASGISAEMHEAVLGCCTGSARLVLLGNPLRREGHFADSFGKKAALYNVLHTGYADVLREAGGIPGLIDEQYVAVMREDYGELGAFRPRCVGEPPDVGDDNLISYQLYEESRARWSPSIATGAAFEAAGPLQVACDPAYFGDDRSAIVARRGNVMLEPVVFHHLDGPQLAARVMEVVDRLRRDGEIVRVVVDSIGIGASLVDSLNRVGRDIDLVPVNVAEASDDERYERKRDEVWHALRDWMKGGGALPPDEKLGGEILAPRFTFSARGRIKVEGKSEIKARLKRSPDLADAACLSVLTDRKQTWAERWSAVCAGDALTDIWIAGGRLT